MADRARRRRLTLPALRIRTQIILPFLLLLLVLGVVGTYLTTSLVSSSLERRVAEQLGTSTEAALTEAVALQGQQLAALRLIANTEGVDAAVASRNSEQLRKLIVPLEVNNRLGSVKVFDSRGRTLLEIDQPDPQNPDGLIFRSGIDLSSDPLVKPVIAGSFDPLGDKYLGFFGSPPDALAASGPIVFGDRVVGGVLLISPLTAVLADLGRQSQSSVLLFDREGNLLARTLAGAGNQLLDAQTKSTLDLASPGRAVRRTLQVQGQPYEMEFTNFYLRQRPAALLAVALPRNGVIAAGVQSALQMTLLFASVVLVLLIIGYLIALRLTRPIEELVGGTRAIARGDLARRVSVHRSDELGELATAFNGMAQDLQERTRSLNEQMRRLAALSHGGHGMGTESEPGAVAEAILKVSLAALGIDRALLLTRDPERAGLEARAAVGLNSHAVSRLRELGPTDLAFGFETAAGAVSETVAEPAADRRTGLKRFALEAGAEQVLVLPLQHAERNAGYLLVGRTRGANLPQEDLEVLKTIATEIALMIENAELRKTAALQAHRLDQAIVALEKISHALTAVTVGTDNLLRAVAHAAAEILEVPYASIHLRHPAWREHFADVIVGTSARREIAAVRGSGAEVARRIDRPEQLLDLDLANPELPLALARRIGLQRAVGVAMSLNGEIAGVLVVHMRSGRRLVRSEVRVLQTLANQAVIAIENAVAYEETKQLALTDPMTGVANHREFEARLERELTRCRRSREPLSVLICDLDHFKQINDGAGHPAGDAVLRHLTNEILVPAVRPRDLVARYGGDEFVLLLRGADGRAAAAVAERIRSAFAGRPLVYDGRVLSGLTLSIGVSTFPRDGETREALVQAADQALYVAKRSGRNRVARSDDESMAAA